MINPCIGVPLCLMLGAILALTVTGFELLWKTRKEPLKDNTKNRRNKIH